MGQLLGDPHNFGRCVQELSDGTLEKPRTIGWEWLFLSRQSPLRLFLCAAFQQASLACPFSLFEDVEFFPSTAAMAQGRVQRIRWKPDQIKLPTTTCQEIGSVIAMLSWFGLGDMHDQNMAIGISEGGRPICMPLDIECIFDDYQLPSQTLLISPKGHTPIGCGLSLLYPLLHDSANSLKAITGISLGYIQAIDLLNREEKTISEIITGISDTSKWPIRVILRDTSDYRIALTENERQWLPPLLPGESEQLKRRDIPYFFRTIESTKISFFSSPPENTPDSAASVLEIGANHTTFPRLGIVRVCKKPYYKFNWQNRRTLREAGLMQLIRSFLPGHLGCGSETIEKMTVSVTTDQINCDLASSNETEQRNLLCKR